MKRLASSLSRQFDVMLAGFAALVILALGLSSGWVPASPAVALCVLVGLVLFAGAVSLFRRHLHGRLKRMVDLMETIRTTGRPMRLPVLPHDEISLLASGVNQLVEQVDDQKRRLREHIQELQRVNAEFEQLAGMKDDFLATVNHQLRTPLTTLVEGVELMRDEAVGPLSAEQKPIVAMMDEHAKRLVQLIEDILDLSMLKSGRRPLERAPGDLGELLRTSQSAWGADAGSRTVRLACGALPRVYMDAAAVRDVLGHLVRNALRHAPDKSEVAIQAELAGDYVAVSVSDRGPGLSADQISRLFQPFVHLQTPESPGSSGSGLGLAFCRQVVERHQGTITVRSAEGQGTTVAFQLPIASPSFMLADACRSAQEEAEYEEGQFGLCLVTPSESQDGAAALSQAESLLRRHTHRGDRFIRLDERTLVIVAVTDRTGLGLMLKRLRELARASSLSVRLVGAAFPGDGDGPERLLEAAQRQLGAMPRAPGKEPRA